MLASPIIRFKCNFADFIALSHKPQNELYEEGSYAIVSFYL